MLYIFITTDVPFKFDLNRITTPNTSMALICPYSFPQASIKSFAKFFDNIDFTEKFDLSSLIALVQKNCKKFNDFSQLILTADESVMMVTAELRDHFRIQGYNSKTIKKFTNKIVMKENLKDHNIDLPRYIHYDGAMFQSNPAEYLQNAISFLDFPIFAKPIDGAASIDTTKIETHNSLLAWCNKHAFDTNFELDEFISGTLYHCDSVIQDGNIKLSLLCEEKRPCFDFASGKMLCSLIVPDRDRDFKILMEFNKRVLQALSPPPNSVTHFEFFKAHDGRIVFLEIAARAPGTKIPQLYEKSFGWNIQEVYFKLQMGLEININQNLEYYAAECMFPRRQGVVLTKNELPQIKSNYEIYWDIEAGQNIARSTDISTTSCSLVLWNKNYDQLRNDIEILDKWSPASMKE